MNRFIFISACLFMFACAQPEGGEDEVATAPVVADSNENSLEGAWEMTFYKFFENDEVTDTVTMNEGYRQIKMYYDGHVMWSRKQPMDSVQLFGYGTYFLDGNTFSENMEFGSHYMMNILDSSRVFNWELEIGEDFYTQTEVNQSGQRVYSETYQRIN